MATGYKKLQEQKISGNCILMWFYQLACIFCPTDFLCKLSPCDVPCRKKDSSKFSGLFAVLIFISLLFPVVSHATHNGPSTFDFVVTSSTSAGETTINIVVVISGDDGDPSFDIRYVSIELDPASTVDSSDYGNAFNDNFPPGTEEIAFPAGAVEGDTQNFTFTIQNDNLIEGTEIAIFNLVKSTRPTMLRDEDDPENFPGTFLGLQDTHTLTIPDDDTAASISFQVASSSTTDETAGNFAVTAVLTYGAGTLAAAATADVVDAGGGTATSGAGQDYSTIVATQISFAAGSPSGSTQTFNLAVLADGIVEGNETVNLELNNAGGAGALGGQTTHEVTITDDDSASVEFQAGTSATLDETTGNFSIPIVLNIPLGSTAIALTVDVTDAGGGSATSTTDYNAVGTSTITFPAGSVDGAVQNFDLGVLQDTNLEADETVNLQLGNPSAYMTLAAQNTHTATITDDETAVVEFQLASSATADESAANHIVTAILNLTGGATLAPVTVDVTNAGGGSALSGTDYTAIGTVTLTFPTGSVNGATQIFNLGVLADTDVEGDETVNLQLGNIVGTDAVLGAQTSHTATITDDDQATIQFQAASSATADETAGNLAITAVLSLPGGTTPVDITVDVTDAGGGSATSATDYNAVGTVTLTFPAGSSNGATQIFNLGVLADTDVEGDESVNLQLGNIAGTGAILGAQTTHTATIIDDDQAIIQFQAASSATVDETAGNLAITAVLSLPGGTTPVDITVDVTDAGGGSATSATDYSAVGTVTLTFPAGSSNGATQVFNLAVLADANVEGDETVNLQLGNITGTGATLGAQTSHTATITDDDQATVQFQAASSSTVDEAAGNHAITAVLNVPGGTTPTDITVDVTDAGGGSATSATDYNAVGTVTLTFPAGSSSGATQIFNLGVLADNDVEGNETVNLQLGNITGTGAILGAQVTHAATITDDDQASVQFQAVSSATANETAGNLAITVILTVPGGATPTDITVDVTDAGGGSATSATDYNAVGTVTLTFPAGSSSGATQIFNLGVLADNDVEGNETVNLQLGNIAGTGATLGAQTSHTATITDDDQATVQFQAASSATADETAGNHAVTVILNLPGGTTPTNITVDVTDAGGGSATSATDYNAVGTVTLTFPAGSSSGATQIFNLGVLADNNVEGNETVNLQLVNIAGTAVTLGAQTSHTATITDDDQATVQFQAVSSATANETAGSHAVTVILNLPGGTTPANITVDVSDVGGGSALSGTDYTAVGTSTLTFPAGSGSGATQIFNLGVLADTNVEGNETVNLQLGNIAGTGTIPGGQTSHTATITDDDQATVQFQAASSATADEAAGNFSITAVLTVPGGSTPTDITVDVTDAGGGSASSGIDYTAIGTATLTFPAGSINGSTQTYNLAVLADTNVEISETVNLQLSNISGTGTTPGAQITHTATITDDDQATVQFQAASSATANETAGNYPVTVVLNLPGGTTPTNITVDVSDAGGGSALSGTDYTAVTSTLTFPAGSSNGATQIFNLVILGDTVVEGDENVNLQLSNVAGIGTVAGAQTTHVVTITDDDQASVQFQVANSNAPELNAAHAVNVVLNLPGGGTTPGIITVDVIDAGGGVASSANDYSAIGVVTLSFPVGSSNGASQVFNLGVLQDTDVEGSEDVNLQLVNVTGTGAVAGAQINHRVDIIDDDQATIQFQSSLSSTVEATSNYPVVAILSVPTGVTPGVITVDITDAGGTATSGIDYNPVGTTTLTFPAGSVSGATQTFNLGLLGDIDVEGNELVNLQMGNVTGINAAPGLQLTHQVTLFDDDQATVSFQNVSSATVDESVANHAVAIVLNLPNGTLPSAVSVDVTDAGGGSASSGVDYTAIGTATLTFPAGSVSGATQIFNLAVLTDGVVEGNETVNLQLGNISGTGSAPGAQTVHVVTITEDDFPADLAVTMTVDNATPTEGSIINYTITVINNGPTDASNLVITDLVPAGLTYISYAATGSTYDNVTGLWSIGSLSVGSSSNISIQVSVDPGTTGNTISNIISNINFDQVDTNVSADVLSELIVVQSQVDGDTSQVTVAPQVVIADGISSGTITVTMLDAALAPKPARDVTVSSSRGATDIIVQPATQTDANGVTTATITSATIGEAIITATDVIDSVTLTMQPTVYFSQGELLDIRITADKKEAVVGDVVNYMVEIRNTTANDVLAVNIINDLPPNFKYVAGSTRLNGGAYADPPGNRQLDFDLGTIPGFVDSNSAGGITGVADPGEAGYVRLTYQLVLGSGVGPGNYVNTVRATDVCNVCFVSNPGTFNVEVILDPLFDLGTIIGKVFHDKNENGRQDEAEPGVAGAMVALDSGVYVLTDEHGRYHFPAVKPGQRAIKINLQSITGYAAATGNAVEILTITPGLMAKANFGITYVDNTQTIGRPPQYGVELNSQQKKEPITINGNSRSLSLLVNGKLLHLSNTDIRMGIAEFEDVVVIKGNKLDAPVRFIPDISHPDKVSTWVFVITGDDKPVREIKGEGKVPVPILWNGKTKSGDMVAGEKIYQYQLKLVYQDGTESNSARRNFGVNKVTAVSMNLSGGAFVTGSAELTEKAKDILAKVGRTLREYPDEKVVMEGHADTTGTEKMNDVLSRQRAEAAVKYLIEVEKINKNRFIVEFYGASKPLADNDTPEGRNLNRRIELKGTVKDVKEVDVLDQYRGRPTVRINGSRVLVDPFGRFSFEVRTTSKSVVNLELSNEQGRSVNKSLLIPELEFLSPAGSTIVGYGDVTDEYKVHQLDEKSPVETAVLTYELTAHTRPGNNVLFNGQPVELDENGRFSIPVDLRTGDNAYDFVVNDPESLSRLSRLIIRVSEHDENGNFIIAVHQIPNLTVKLPPEGRKLTTPELTISGHTDVGNVIHVNKQLVTIASDGSFATELNLPSGKNQIIITATDVDGYVGTIEHEVEVDDNRLFLLAIADGKIGQMRGKGTVQT